VRHGWSIRVALGLAAALASFLCAAEGYSTYRTTSGCEISDAFSATSMSWLPSDWERTKTWSGACVGGKAEGWGLYVTTARFGGADKFVLTVRGFAHDSKLVGYARVIATSVPANASSSSWLYAADGQTVGGTGRLGLSITDLAMDAPGVALPVSMAWRGPAVAPETASLLAKFWTTSRSISLFAMSCGVHADRFPDCKPGSPQANAWVFFIQDQRLEQRPGVADPSKKLTFCPNPRSLSGCEATVEQVVAPYRQEVLDFIQRTKPAVEALLAASRATLAAMPQASTLNEAPAR